MTKFLLVAAVAAVASSTSAAARKPERTATPAQVQRLLGCRSIADSALRVQCFDREAAALEGAITKKDLVLVDRATANATRRSLFGFSVPNFGNLFGDDAEEVKQIQSTVARATNRGIALGWTITLADGSVWAQSDDSPIALAPRKGDKVLVRRGSLGSYSLSIAGQPGVKVRRIG